MAVTIWSGLFNHLQGHCSAVRLPKSPRFTNDLDTVYLVSAMLVEFESFIGGLLPAGDPDERRRLLHLHPLSDI